MWTLYDFLPSGNGYKVRLTLRELGRPFAYRQIDILRGETREPWFLAKNPVGQIPVLELDDGTCLNESSAILFYIAEGTALLPSDPVARARVLQWMCFEQQNVDNVISRARFRKLYPDAVPTRPEEFEPWWKQGTRALRILDEHLQTRTYLVEDHFSIADITLFAYVHCAEEGGFDLEPFEALQSWLARIKARPAHLAVEDVPS
jgi:glutathione S-transferase